MSDRPPNSVLVTYRNVIGFGDMNNYLRSDGPSLIRRFNKRKAWTSRKGYHRTDGEAMRPNAGDLWFYLNGIDMEITELVNWFNDRGIDPLDMSEADSLAYVLRFG